MQDQWGKVDTYFEEIVTRENPVLTTILENNRKEGLPTIDVSVNQAKMLHIYALMIQAKNILEIGTLGGYSTVAMASALPSDGRLVTLEYDAHHATVARRNIALAGLEDKVEVMVGEALVSLPKLADVAPFDLIFIDADKQNNPQYLEWALKYSRVGTVIIGDNVVRQGKVVTDDGDEAIVGIRDFLVKLGQQDNVVSTAIQTVGSKGWDGFSLSIVR